MTVPATKHIVLTLIAFIIGGTFCLWIAGAGLGAHGSTATSFEEANRAFAENHFDEAAQKLEAVIAAHGYSASALFNLGNAYLCSGRTGLAILNYQRASLLAPHDADIAANLRAARAAAGIDAARLPWYGAFTRALSPDTWAWLASFALLGLCAALLANAFWPGKWMPSRFTAIGCAVVLATALGAVVLCVRQVDGAVVTTKNAVARLSPFASATTAFPLNEGQTVAIEGFHAGFALVTTADGRRGWVAASDFAPLIPTQPVSANTPTVRG